MFRRIGPMRNFLCAAASLAAALPLALAPAMHAHAGLPYDYPIDPGTPQWESFTTHTQMLAATQIPEPVLASMSTADLVTSVLNYPLFLDRVAYNSPQQGFDIMASRFNGIGALYARRDAFEALIQRYRSLTEAALTAPLSPDSTDSDIANVEMLLAQGPVLRVVTDADLEVLVDVATHWLEAMKYAPDDISTPTGEETTLLLLARAVATLTETPWTSSDFVETGTATSVEVLLDVEAAVAARAVAPEPVGLMPTQRDYQSTVYTPKGSAVPVMTMTYELSSTKISEYNRYVATRYPRATRETNASRKYNCHSYAWYSTSTSNNRWMNSPSDDRYWTDGSYLRWHPPLVWKSTVRMSYRSDDHSSRNFSDGWRSKWGQLPRMKHAWDYSPYDDTYHEYYYLAGT